MAAQVIATNYFTITNVVTVANPVDPAAVLRDLGGLYTNAYGHLLTNFGAALGLIVLVVGWLQARQLKIQEREMEERFQASLKESMAALKKDQLTQLEADKSELVKLADRRMQETVGQMMTMLGVVNATPNAEYSLIMALHCMSEAGVCWTRLASYKELATTLEWFPKLLNQANAAHLKFARDSLARFLAALETLPDPQKITLAGSLQSVRHAHEAASRRPHA